ncbi:MAG TPA: alpha/beta fold hydrolase [Gaiellaceae bacterium]
MRSRVVLVHGLAGSPRWWRPILPALRDYDVRYVDPRDVLTADADDVLIGHSLGGLRAVQYAAQRQVRKLVLVDPVGVASGRLLPFELLEMLRATTPAFFPTVAFDALRWGPRALLRHGFEASRTRADLTRITAPTLIVWGERDSLVPVRLATHWHKAIPGSRLEVIAGARHVPMVENPSAFTEVLLDFLGDERGIGVVDGVRAARQLDEPPAR